MADIISISGKDRAPDNLISRKPFEFRRADWENSWFIQMLKSQSQKLEAHRLEVYRRGGKGAWQIPPHHSLKGGTGFTIRGLYLHREDEERMREVYYLAALVDCMINQVHPLLRTDLFRDIYKRTLELKNSLHINWYGHMDRVLLPIDDAYHNEQEYRQMLSRAGSMKDLYRSIREGSDEMFDILSLEYTFYTPGRGYP